MEQALIAIVGALVGILLTNGIRLILEARERAGKVRDIQTALRAEVRSHRRALELFGDGGRLATTFALIVAEEGYSPFIPREADPSIFNATLAEIHILPGRVIDPVVLYYRQWQGLNALAEDMRSAAFGALSQARKAAVYQDYGEMGAYALDLAKDAVDAINLSLRDRETG